ncbi:hypothetical protein NUSPORA_01287 [Nucleospora cyclopteri]
MLSFITNIVIFSLIFYNSHLYLLAEENNELKTRKMKKYYKYFFFCSAVLLAMDNLFSFILYRIPYYQFVKLLTFAAMSNVNSTAPQFIYTIYIRNVQLLFSSDVEKVKLLVLNYAEIAHEKYKSILKKTPKSFSSSSIEQSEIAIEQSEATNEQSEKMGCEIEMVSEPKSTIENSEKLSEKPCEFKEAIVDQ